jgi:hypothetical protein
VTREREREGEKKRKRGREEEKEECMAGFVCLIAKTRAERVSHAAFPLLT